MAALQEFKCPRCGGALSFDPGSQAVQCPYCDTYFKVEDLLAYDQSLHDVKPDEMLEELNVGSQWEAGETDGMLVYVCKSCGGEIVADATTGATKCPYCDNPVVVKEKFAGDLKPDFVIPFKLDKEAAKAGLQRHMKGKKLLPKVFRDEGHIDEIKGVYVPVWLYDTDAEGYMTFHGERVRSWSDHDYDYTETSYYSLVRGGDLSFENIPVDGSVKMDDAIMESLEPFDFSEAVPFQVAYLPGFLADRYDQDAQERLNRANERIRATVQATLEETLGPYTMVTQESGSVRLYNTTAKYALYPVWLLSTHWQDKNYLFAMNGQTGKFVGDLPQDKGLTAKYGFGIFAGVTVLGLIISLLRWLL